MRSCERPSLLPPHSSCLALAGQAQPPNRKGGGRGGFAPKNLQVLDPATLPEAMQSYVQALGLLDKGVCNYCHVEDRASDEKMQKMIARNMITMVREINSHFPDTRPHVTCYTCHRGSTTPAMAP
jgi:photosynthetic reaction center cytochrome c subunit